MILAPTNYLLKQWEERIMQFTGQKCYSATSSAGFKYINTYNYYIFTLDMFNSLLNSNSKECSEALAELLKDIGLVILDEAHRCGADSYHPILNRLPAKRRLALTATFRRIDEREKILQHHFGKSYEMENQFPPAHFYAVETGITIGKLVPKDKLNEDLSLILDNAKIPYTETESYINFLGSVKTDVAKLSALNKINKNTKKLLLSDLVFAQLDNFVAEHSGRSKMVQSFLNMCLETDRTVLVLSKRKEILKRLHAVYSKVCRCALVIQETNNITDDERARMQSECKIIFGINQLAMEGLDIDRLDTLLLIHPVADTEQPIGRIIRYVPYKKQPIAVTLLDDCHSYFGLYRKSHKFVQLNATIKGSIKLKDLRSKL